MKTDQQLQMAVTAQVHGDPILTQIEMAAPVAGDAVPRSGSAPRCAEQPDAERVGDLGAGVGTSTDAPSVRISIEALFVLLVVLLFNI